MDSKYKEIMKAVKEDYEETYNLYGKNVKSLKWGSIQSQQVRFKVLYRIEWLRRNSYTLLDVGCGFGDLYQFLLQQRLQPKHYTGIDISEHTIREAKLSFKDNNFVDFKNTDIFELGQNASFDLVFTSGIFNVLNCKNWVGFVMDTLKEMFRRANRLMIFNMQSIWGKDYVKHLQEGAILDPIFWLLFVKNELSPYIQLYHDYMEADFTLVVFKKKNDILNA